MKKCGRLEGQARFWPFGGMEGPWKDTKGFGGSGTISHFGGMEGPEQILHLEGWEGPLFGTWGCFLFFLGGGGAVFYGGEVVF